jgi:tRNA threonylcarbamoyladenosine biosynthesis protein TsaE
VIGYVRIKGDYMNQYEKYTKDPSETFQLASNLAELLQPGDVICLEGDLGAGKTTFTKGVAKGLDIKKTVNSPTFTIIKEYRGRLPLYHMDVYRVADSYEDLGFDEYFEGEGVTVVEWAHLIEEQLPNELLTIYLYHEGSEKRKMVFVPKGKRYEQLCKEIFLNDHTSD